MINPLLLKATRDEAHLRQLLRIVLLEWMERLDRDKVRIHIPRPRGLKRLIPGKHFHLHPELFLQLSGETLFEFPEEKVRVGPGQLCLIPRGLPHYETIRPLRGPFYNIVFMYDVNKVYSHVAEQGVPGRPKSCTGTSLRHLTVGMPIISTLDQACEIALVHNEARTLGIKGLMLAHLALLLKALEGWSEPHEPEPFKVAQTRQLVLRQLPNPDLSVASLAKQLQCSVDYLSQLFRKTTGTPLLTYINNHRLARAQDLLKTTSLNIAEVSQAAGFRDASYFTRFFHRQTGLTPRAYRLGD